MKAITKAIIEGCRQQYPRLGGSGVTGSSRHVTACREE